MLKLNHALVFATLALGVLATTGCQQPDLNCTVFHGYYAAKYELENGDATSPCGEFAGDILGLNSYYADAGGRPDLEDGSMALRPQHVNALIFYAAGVEDLTAAENAQSVGEFTAGRPGAGDFCEAPSLSDAAIDIPDVPEQPEVMDDPATTDVDETAPLVPGQAPTAVSYEWSDVRVLVNADAQGTQLSAELHFEQDGCAADYHVTALYPAVPCMTDEDCDDDANGINPGFATVCDLGLAGPARYPIDSGDGTYVSVGPVQYYLGDPTFTGGLCVLAEDPPSYQ
jgi:hypothetical protein